MFELGCLGYALEHTGIEPFPNLMKLNLQSQILNEPVVQRAIPLLPDDEIFNLSIPLGALLNRPGGERRRIQTALADSQRLVPKPGVITSGKNKGKPGS